MYIKFKATGFGPKHYDINGEIINGIDFSVFKHGDKFIGDDKTQNAGIRDAYRDEKGELHITLKQVVITSQLKGRKAHWREGSFIAASEYNPDKCYVVPTGVADLVEGKDYQIVKGIDSAGAEGWTITEVKNGLVQNR